MIDKILRPCGSFLPWGEEHEEKYLYDDEQFYDEDGNPLTEETMKEWALWLNSPWSYADVHYDIHYNCKDAYTPIEEGEPHWKCELTVVGYDGATATLIGYGNAIELDALSNCVQLFESIQKKYNPNNESV